MVCKNVIRSKNNIGKNSVHIIKKTSTETIKTCDSKIVDKISRIKTMFEKRINNFYGFRTLLSRDISIELLTKAEKDINRTYFRTKLNDVVDDIVISSIIEKGLFEFALTYVVGKKLQNELVRSIYQDRFYNLYDNLDIKNKNIGNKEFIKFVKCDYSSAYFAAFLSPMQMFPSNWVSISNNIKRREDVIYEMKTTDRYKCSKCKQRKFYVFEMQMRSADEPSSFFYTCSVCCKTFIK